MTTTPAQTPVLLVGVISDEFVEIPLMAFLSRSEAVAALAEVGVTVPDGVDNITLAPGLIGYDPTVPPSGRLLPSPLLRLLMGKDGALSPLGEEPVCNVLWSLALRPFAFGQPLTTRLDFGLGL